MRTFPGLVDWLMRYGARARLFQAGRKPQNIASLRAERQILQGLSLEAELAWTVAYLKSEAPRINSFIIARKLLQQTLLNKSGSECIEALNRIEMNFGVSLWSIEQRIALISLYEGLEAQKQFVQHVRHESRSSTVRFFVSMWSVRNEMATHFDTFKREIVSRMPEWTESKQFASYALMRTVDQWQPTRAAIANALRWEYNSSTVDIYELLVRVAQRAVSTRASTLSEMANAIHALTTDLVDDRLSMILLLAQIPSDPPTRFPQQSTPLSDARLEGRDTDFSSDPIESQAVEDLVASSLFLAETGTQRHEVPEEPLSQRLVRLLADLASKGPGFEDSRGALLHIYTNFNALDIAGCIQLATLEQVLPDPPDISQYGVEAFCRTAELHPGMLQYLPADMKSAYVALLTADGFCSATLVAEQIKAGLEPSWAGTQLTANVERYCKAQANYKAKQYRAVAAFAKDIGNDTRPESRAFARLTASALIHAGQVIEAIRFIVERAINDPVSIAMLPIGECYLSLTETINEEMAGDLALPLLVDLQSRHVFEQTTVLRYRYEDFLANQHCTKPSELGDRAEHLPKEPLVYFLRQVCIPRVMQMSLQFPTSRAVSDERLSVCVLLRRLDPANATAYEAEILEITRQQGISQGVQAVEQSKIWIDQEPIRRWAERHLNEGFRRLIDLQAVGIETHIEVGSNQLEPINTEQIAKALEVPEFPADEAGVLLRRLVSQFLAHCFISKPHGLDNFLSIRVRHGVLAGQMRAAPEAEKIISLQRQAGVSEYFPNTYWMERFSDGDPEIALRVDSRLQQFSGQYDQLVDRFVSARFQINRDDKPLGLFHFGYLPTDLLILQADLHQASSFDVFIDRCFQVFWNSVDASLEQVRDHIDHTLQIDLNRIFIDLINDMEATTLDQPSAELGYALRNAHTRATNALEQVKQWFRPARPRASATATFQELVDISLQVVRNMDVLFNPTLQLKTEGMPLFFQLQKFTDIFIILFDNVRRHCAVGPTPLVTVQANLTDSFLNIMVSNDVDEGVINDTTLQKLAMIRQKIEQGQHQRALSTEGGTGLLKIRNILFGDSADASALAFGFEEKSFRVNLRISSVVMEMGHTGEHLTAS